MSFSSVRWLYSIAAVAAQPFVRRKLRRRGRAEPGYLDSVGERFGQYEGRPQPGALWIHAVSLGETRAASILIDRLRHLQPNIRILLTHGTATGRAEGARLLRPGDAQAWLPWDTPHAVRCFLDHFKPRAGLMMETEVWPNLVSEASRRGLPLMLANARLSDKSLAGTRRLAWLSRPAYAALTAVWAQTEADAQRLRAAGAQVQGVFGNLKFDAQPQPQQLQQGRRWREASARPVLMFASSREGEELEFFRAIKSLAQPLPMQVLLVPRHPQRFAEVQALAEQHGLSVTRRSHWRTQPEPADVWLGDSLGEMALYYGMSHVALLGGSFAPLGGQNLIEAAACGTPVVMGPHTFNFAQAAQMAQQCGAALRVQDMGQAVHAAQALLADPVARDTAVRSALAFAAANQGAADKTAQAVLRVLGPVALAPPAAAKA